MSTLLWKGKSLNPCVGEICAVNHCSLQNQEAAVNFHLALESIVRTEIRGSIPVLIICNHAAFLHCHLCHPLPLQCWLRNEAEVDTSSARLLFRTRHHPAQQHTGKSGQTTSDRLPSRTNHHPKNEAQAGGCTGKSGRTTKNEAQARVDAPLKMRHHYK